MSNEYVVSRLKLWARCKDLPPHEPGRPAESVEWRMMTREAFVRSGKRFSGGDGGMARAVTQFPDALREQRQTAEMNRALSVLKHRNKRMHDVVHHAFATHPGRRVSAPTGAMANGMSETEWRRQLRDGLQFLDGVLAVAA